MPPSSRAWPVLLGLLAAGCTNRIALQPAPTAQVVEGVKDAAAAEASGIRVVVEGGQWRGDPGDLGSMATPVRVTIENQSGWPLRIRFKEFALTTAPGVEARALPPLQLQRPGAVIVTPPHPYSGFFVAPPFSGSYPGLNPWGGPWEFDPFYYDSYTQWERPLPTRDMLEKALPEGVLEDGGRMSGYLYFQPIGHDVREVSFSADLVNASTGEVVGRVSIPFTVKR